ncbi:HD-domain/PDEase-like protein [Panus rudis PR-1116 ss-1]|nr:HD-domain/PDEase-like protein [Panus rudis PR-1116 ss-1]
MHSSNSLSPSFASATRFPSGGQLRRRSVDVGGLALALKDHSLGHGWGGWEEGETGETRYAENLIDVREHTEMVVKFEDFPTDVPLLDPPTRTRLIASLSSWRFEPQSLSPDEVLSCAYILFEAIYTIEGMYEQVGVPLSQLPPFLNLLQCIYRRSNSYHNFEHALDVFQAVYCILRWENVVPPLDILLSAPPSPSNIDNPIPVSDIPRTWQRPPAEDPHSLIQRLTNADIFALCIAAVGHDVGHPGLTNAFLKNAQTPLAVVYEDKSVLEQMHSLLMLQVMRHTGLGSLISPCASTPSPNPSASPFSPDPQPTSQTHTKSFIPANLTSSEHHSDPPLSQASSDNVKIPALSSPASSSTSTSSPSTTTIPPGSSASSSTRVPPTHPPPNFKKLLLLTVLSTDMSVHDEFMQQFDALIRKEERRRGAANSSGGGGLEQETEDEKFRTKVLVCQALIKCTDISNPARPYLVSQRWAAALSHEWSSQLQLERHLHLPASVYPSSDELGQARGQVFFIERFAGPLFDSVKRGIPEVGRFARQCKDNLRIWQDLKDKLSTPPPSSSLPSDPATPSSASTSSTAQGDRATPSPKTIKVPPPSSDVPSVVQENSATQPLSPTFPSAGRPFPVEFLNAFPPTLPKSFLRESDMDAEGSDYRSMGDSAVVGDDNSSSPGGSVEFSSANGSLGSDLDSGSEDGEGSQYETCESESGSEGVLITASVESGAPGSFALRAPPATANGSSHRHRRTRSGISTASMRSKAQLGAMPVSPLSPLSPSLSNSHHPHPPSQPNSPHRHAHHRQHHRDPSQASSAHSRSTTRTSFTHNSVMTFNTAASSSMQASASALVTNATDAIRKAYKASVRKTKSTRSFHRSSWNPSPVEFNTVINGSRETSHNADANVPAEEPKVVSAPIKSVELANGRNEPVPSSSPRLSKMSSTSIAMMKSRSADHALSVSSDIS